MSPKEIGAAVQQARSRKKMTQPQLAVAAGVSIGFVSRLEKGHASARFDKLLRVFDILDLALNVTPR